LKIIAHTWAVKITQVAHNMGFNYKLRKDVFILMTILETFIKLRDDLKTWVTNNLNQKANISYVDEKFAMVPEPEAITNETIDIICGGTIESADEVMF
jgi:hypothetical protein